MISTCVVGKCLRPKTNYVNRCVNRCGLLLFALFLSMTLATLPPFQCRPNGEGSSWMVTEPGVECWASESHLIMVLLGLLGIVSQPLAVICWTTYTTLMYPSRCSKEISLLSVDLGWK